MGWKVFGCDICQDVCPWNRKAPFTSSPPFQAREKLLAPELSWLLSLTEAEFSRIFSRSALRRAKWRGFIRKARPVAGQLSGHHAARPPEWAQLCPALGGVAA